MRPLRSDGLNNEQREVSIIDPDDDVSAPRGNPQDAEHHDVGMAADPQDSGMIGGAPYEVEPRGDDILPDQIQRFADAPAEEDVELTARPREPQNPLSPEELPEG